MTTIISRHYADAKTADGVVAALHDAGFPEETVMVIGSADTQAMMDARVAESTAMAYASAMSAKSTLVVVHAPFTPFGAAMKAKDIVNAAPSMRLDGQDENRYISETPNADLYLGLSVMRSHPRFLSADMNPRANANRALLSQAFHWPLLTKHRARRALGKHGPVLPFGTIKHKTADSAIKGGKRMMYNPS